MRHRCAVCDRDVGVYPRPHRRPRGVTDPAPPLPGRFMRHRFTGDAPVPSGLSAGDWCPGSGAPVPREAIPNEPDPTADILAAGWQFVPNNDWTWTPAGSRSSWLWVTPVRPAGGPYAIVALTT